MLMKLFHQELYIYSDIFSVFLPKVLLLKRNISFLSFKDKEKTFTQYKILLNKKILNILKNSERQLNIVVEV